METEQVCEHRPITCRRASDFYTNAQTLFCRSYINFSYLIKFRIEALQEPTEEKISALCYTYYANNIDENLAFAYSEISHYLHHLLKEALESQIKWQISYSTLGEVLQLEPYRCCHLTEYGCCFCKYYRSQQSQRLSGQLFKELWTMLLASDEITGFGDTLTKENVETIAHFFENNFKSTATAREYTSYLWNEIEEIKEYALAQCNSGVQCIYFWRECRTSNHKKDVDDIIKLFGL